MLTLDQFNLWLSLFAHQSLIGLVGVSGLMVVMLFTPAVFYMVGLSSAAMWVTSSSYAWRHAFRGDYAVLDYMAVASVLITACVAYEAARTMRVELKGFRPRQHLPS